jgi:hypothetical protein
MGDPSVPYQRDKDNNNNDDVSTPLLLSPPPPTVSKLKYILIKK